MATLILLRHGQSTWNLENLFTGWVDVGLTEQGEQEAVHGGELVACDRSWIPVRRSWRLNERHYGALQGKDKKQTAEEFGEEKLLEWRRSYDAPPPPLDWDASEDPRYRDLPTELIPKSECLADVVERM